MPFSVLIEIKDKFTDEERFGDFSQCFSLNFNIEDYLCNFFY